MITLIHGDQVEMSRGQLTKLKEESKGQEIRMLDGRTLDFTSLLTALATASLFGNKPLVVVENLFSKQGKKEKLIKQITALLKETPSTGAVILWEEKEISKTQLAALGPQIKVWLFKTPRVIFSFLDNLRPNNANTLLNFYSQLITTEASEVVLAMMGRRVRQLLQLVDGVKPPGLADWQLARLTRQARFFTMERLRTMYQQLLEIELAIKTGTSPFTLSQHIEQLIIDL